jgi:hypothetical protein
MRVHAIARPQRYHPLVRINFKWERIKPMLRQGWREYKQRDMRWSYLVIGVLIVCGIIVNLLLAHGWTVWPFVFAAGLLLMLHEAVDRNGQGVPPLYAYALLGSAITFWMLVVVVLKAVNPIVLLLGFLGLCYYAALGYQKQLDRVRLVASRRADGCCIHCGYPADPRRVYCSHCGEEPDPDTSRLGRIATSERSTSDKARTRAALTPPAPTASAKAKEQALLSRRHSRGGRKK